MAVIKLGYAPTRRSIFSAPDAIKYRGLTADRLRELGIDFVDIDDINEEGLLYDDNDVKKIVAKFRKEGVDGIIFPALQLWYGVCLCEVGKGDESSSDAVGASR